MPRVKKSRAATLTIDFSRMESIAQTSVTRQRFVSCVTKSGFEFRLTERQVIFLGEVAGNLRWHQQSASSSRTNWATAASMMERGLVRAKTEEEIEEDKRRLGEHGFDGTYSYYLLTETGVSTVKWLFEVGVLITPSTHKRRHKLAS